MYKFIALALFLLLAQPAFAAPLSLEEIIEASCRITAVAPQQTQRGWEYLTQYGSGTVIREYNDKYYILTNGHVVDRSVSVTVEFFHDGYKSVTIPANVIKCWYQQESTVDLALLTIPKSSLKDYSPKVILLAPQDYIVQENDLIMGAGCPAGTWSQAWQTRIRDVKRNSISFYLAPYGGQSGSGICANIDDETYVVGILSWNVGVGDDRYGAGVSLQRIWEVVYGEPERDTLNVDFKYVDFVQEAVDSLCETCGRPRAEHSVRNDSKGNPIKYTNGQIKLFCPKCPKHGLTHKEHIDSGFTEDEFCGPGGCFPRPTTPPPTPKIRVPPTETIPPDLFPGRVEKKDGCEEKLAAANSVIENLKIQLELEKEKRENALQEILTLSNQLNLAESSISNTENKLKLVEQEKVSLEESTNEWIEKYTSLEDAVENEKHWLEKTTDGAAGNKTENVSFTVLGGLSALSLLKIFGPMLARRGAQKIGDKITSWNPPAPEQRPDPPPPGWMKGDSGEWVPDPRYSTPIVNSSAQPSQSPTGYVKHEHLGTVQHIHKGLENTVQTTQPQFDIPPEKFPGPINPTQTPPKVTNELDPGFLPHGYVKKKN